MNKNGVSRRRQLNSNVADATRLIGDIYRAINYTAKLMGVADATDLCMYFN